MSPHLPDNLDRNACAALDDEDPLARFRDRFLDDGSTIYLDGNSMGRLPKAAIPRLQEMAEHEWGTILVRGWTEFGVDGIATPSRRSHRRADRRVTW